MKAKTLAILEALTNLEWFSNAGAMDVDGVDFAASWQHANACCSTRDWESSQIAGANLISTQLAKNAMDRYREWNYIVADLKEVLHPLIDEKCARVIAENTLSRAFRDSVRWDTLNIGIEAEYSDVTQPAFFTFLYPFYLAGNFPCGWRGPFPTGGRLTVY